MHQVKIIINDISILSSMEKKNICNSHITYIKLHIIIKITLY